MSDLNKKKDLSEKIENIEPVEKLFHNEYINVYETTIGLDEIIFWPENLRTLLAFEELESKFNKKIQDITEKEIVEILRYRTELKIKDLANSIEKNGVRVPLIILTDHTLLDGNRRYFACIYLRENKKMKKDFKVPVWIIKKGDVDSKKKQKILAEFNFVDDYKVKWTVDVQAKVINDYFDNCLKEKKSKEEAYNEIKDVYGLKKANVDDFIKATYLTKEFVKTAGDDKKKEFELREIVLDKYVYFWEFCNKAYAGRGKLEGEMLIAAKRLFFKMIRNECFQNIKQVYPMIRAYHDDELL